MPQSADLPASKADRATTEATALLIVMGLLAAIALFGVLVASQQGGFGLSWEGINPVVAYTELEHNLTGPGCPILLQRAQLSIDGQYARVTIEQFGTFEVQSHYLRFYTTRAISEVIDTDQCRYTPQRPARLIWQVEMSDGPA
jgi:hypothetical protein